MYIKNHIQKDYEMENFKSTYQIFEFTVLNNYSWLLKASSKIILQLHFLSRPDTKTNGSGFTWNFNCKITSVTHHMESSKKEALLQNLYIAIRLLK